MTESTDNDFVTPDMDQQEPKISDGSGVTPSILRKVEKSKLVDVKELPKSLNIGFYDLDDSSIGHSGEPQYALEIQPHHFDNARNIPHDQLDETIPLTNRPWKTAIEVAHMWGSKIFFAEKGAVFGILGAPLPPGFVTPEGHALVSSQDGYNMFINSDFVKFKKNQVPLIEQAVRSIKEEEHLGNELRTLDGSQVTYCYYFDKSTNTSRDINRFGSLVLAELQKLGIDPKTDISTFTDVAFNVAPPNLGKESALRIYAQFAKTLYGIDIHNDRSNYVFVDDSSSAISLVKKAVEMFRDRAWVVVPGNGAGLKKEVQNFVNANGMQQDHLITSTQTAHNGVREGVNQVVQTIRDNAIPKAA